MTVKFFEVGGCVRDEILGVQSKDIDFTVEADSFDHMRDTLLNMGFMIFLETPDFLTIRARFPKGHKFARQTADFVLARKDGAYSDGRRPDSVQPGTILDDLARRDFTVNAIAKDEKGNFIDPFGGQKDLAARRLRAVGSARDRIHEDALRGLRAVRFSITKGFWIDDEILEVIDSEEFRSLLQTISQERIREEMNKAFAFDTFATINLLHGLGLVQHIFKDGLWLKPTLERP